jgi:DNA (cytosine-5)-methyltransferase 1
LWSEFKRIIGEVRPAWVFIENSPRLRTKGLVRVLKNLAELGYDARWDVFGAAHLGAPISGDECGLLPSCRASDADRGGRGDLLQALRGNGNSHFRLPTPTASLYGSNQGGASGRVGEVRHSLEHWTGGPWPSFREWMMGWPIGWTACAPLATDRFQEWLRWHGQRWKREPDKERD